MGKLYIFWNELIPGAGALPMSNRRQACTIDRLMQLTAYARGSVA